MCIFSFWSVLEQLVNCFLNASARNIMNCSIREVFSPPIFLKLFINWQIKSIGTFVGGCAAAARHLLPDSSTCLQEAVDELFQHTLVCKIVHNPSFKLTFESYQTLILDEIASICLKLRLPPDAFKKQLTICCSTPGLLGLNKTSRLSNFIKKPM